jgi:glycerophosphoryl diester phosphodiesterase
MDEPFLIYAHRGSSLKYPENTMLAFEKAVLAGANGIELDVQLTRDKKVIIFHDWRLNRIFNKEGKISNYRYDQIKTWDAGIWKSKKFKGLTVPTLEEVLIFAAKKKIVLNIELKNFFSGNNGLEHHVIRLIKKHNLMNQTVISTFNPLSLQMMHEIEPAIPLALLYFGFLDSPWEFAAKYHCQYIHPPVSQVSEEMVIKAKEHHLKVIPYHVNNKESIQKMIRLGVHGIITSRPRTAATILNELNKK